MGELIVNGLKMALAVAAGLAFAVALTSLLSLLVSLTASNIIGEVLGIISIYLPFDAGVVFSALGLSCTAILSFMVARKIWDLTTNTISVV